MTGECDACLKKLADPEGLDDINARYMSDTVIIAGEVFHPDDPLYDTVVTYEIEGLRLKRELITGAKEGVGLTPAQRQAAADLAKNFGDKPEDHYPVVRMARRASPGGVQVMEIARSLGGDYDDNTLGRHLPARR